MGIPAEAGGTVGSPRKSPVKRRDADRDGRQGPDKAEKSTRPRSGARRRRTRGGQPVTAHPAGTNGEAASTTPETPSGAPAAGSGSNRRRRRRRKPASQPSTAPAAAN
jgi:hypothetical protein